MPRKSKDEAEKTRKRILASALSLFVAKGYERATFTDIAARLKMTKGAVYWHFESKEKLLIALVGEMLERFEQQTAALMPKSELTYEAVAEMMVQVASTVVKDPRRRAFFLLMKTQVRWGDASMRAVREDLVTNDRFGPWHAFRLAVENDRKVGRVRADVDPETIAHISLSAWDGLVQATIDGFLRKDLAGVVRQTFDAIWASIKR